MERTCENYRKFPQVDPQWHLRRDQDHHAPDRKIDRVEIGQSREVESVNQEQIFRTRCLPTLYGESETCGGTQLAIEFFVGWPSGGDMRVEEFDETRPVELWVVEFGMARLLPGESEGPQPFEQPVGYVRQYFFFAFFLNDPHLNESFTLNISIFF